MTKNSLKGIIITLVAILISIILFIIIGTQNLEDKLLGDILNNIALTILITSTIGAAYNFTFKNEIVKDVGQDVRHQLDNYRNFEKIGLSTVYPDSKRFNFSNFIVESKKIIVIINDGKAWKSTYEMDFKERLSKKDLETIFIFPNYNLDEINTLMLRKTGHVDDENYIKNKVNLVIRSLTELKSEQHKLAFYKHDLFNTSTIMLSENEIILSPYRLSRGKDVIPLYIYKSLKRDCVNCLDCTIKQSAKTEYCNIKRDVESLLEESKIIELGSAT